MLRCSRFKPASEYSELELLEIQTLSLLFVTTAYYSFEHLNNFISSYMVVSGCNNFIEYFFRLCQNLT